MAGSAFTVEQASPTGIQGAKAWVIYSTDTGAAVVKASYNIDSVVRNSSGNCTVNITPGTFTSGDYAVASGVGGAGLGGGGPFPVGITVPVAGSTPTATALTVQTINSLGGTADAQYVSLIFFGS
jgi:hypothetical protein